MRLFRAFADSIQQPSFEQVDSGSGGGAGAGAGSGAAGAGSGQQSAGSSQVGAPISLADDTPLTIDGKTTTWKDYRTGNFVPKSEFENVRQATRSEIERNLRALAAKMNLKPQAQPQPRVDPFAKVRGLPIVDGDTVAQLAEAGFGQIGQTLQQQQTLINQLAQQLKKMQGGVGTLAKERAGQERTSRVSEAISSLGEGYDAKDPFLNDVAQDLLDAWEFEKPDEFPKMLATRLSQMEKFIRARDKAKLDNAKKRVFVRSGGSATANGTPRFNPKADVANIADQFFGSRAANT